MPFPPGGGTDTLGRIVGQKLGESLGQQVVIDNRPGAGANIGAELAAKAPPDGYTIFMGNVAHTINASLYSKLNYDLVRDFAPVTMLGLTANIVVVHPSVPARSLKELIALAKARPGELNYASSGSGSSSHLAGELFKNMAHINMTHIPYKGAGRRSSTSSPARPPWDSRPCLLRCRTSKPVNCGRWRSRPASARRPPRICRPWPKPVFPDMRQALGYCLLLPAGTPHDIVARLNAEMVKVLGHADVKNRLTGLGYEITTTTPEQLAAHIRSEIAKWGKVVKATGIHVD